MVLYAKQYGVAPGKDVSKEINDMFASLSVQTEPVIVILEPGIYHLTADQCPKVTMYISNASVGDSSMYGNQEGDDLHVVPVGWDLENLQNVTVQGKGAHFVAHGKMTHIFLRHCQHLSVDGVTFSAERPDFHFVQVQRVSETYVDFALDASDDYQKMNEMYYFAYGDGQEPGSPIYPPRKGWDCAHCYDVKNENHYIRTIHPLRNATSFENIADHVFRATYASTEMFEVGQRYGLYHCGRRYNGIVIDGCLDITLRCMTQHFNYGLAVVAQDTEQITITACTFAPNDDSMIKTASCADFIQLSMCKGQIDVTDNYFCGAGDDVLNVHGIHFIVDQVTDNVLQLSFAHSETYGFCPLHVGDTVEYVDRETLLATGQGVIRSVQLTDLYHLLVEVDDANGAVAGCALEDTTMCPNLYFARNTMTRIVTRGLLITTRGKVVVEDNDFLDLTMDSILVSNDAGKWYESGPVHDLTIRNNRFDACGEYYLEVCPENGDHTQPVHRNIRLESNDFTQPRGIYAKCVDGFVVRGNSHPMPMSDALTMRYVTNAVVESNTVAHDRES